MADVLPLDAETVRDIRSAARDCSERGLINGAKWASELLLSIPRNRVKMMAATRVDPDASTFSSLHSSTPARPSATSRPSMNFAMTSTPFNTKSAGSHEASIDGETEEEEEDVILAAKALFDMKEYHRVPKVLAGCQSSKARFLSVYSRYLNGERRALISWYSADGSRTQGSKEVNETLRDLCQELSNVTDPWLLFLKGLFLFRLSRREEAIEALIDSVSKYAWNWSAWLALIDCIDDGEEMAALVPLIRLPPNHALVLLFQAQCLLQLNYPNMNEASYCQTLLGQEYFPRSLFIMTLHAKILFNLHEHGESEHAFETIRALDPERIDGLDIYSNILYLTNNRLKLSSLAHDLLAVNKDRPEVSCILGNHYSLRGEHEKSIKYFRRATHLDRNYVAAWTLLGHEYVEQKNSHAAIESYRRAIDANRRDYRAWYGLGQAYELMNMHQYSLHYFQQATTLRPYDVRLWQAQGQCYHELDRPREAIECYKHALLYADPLESTIHLKIAEIYDHDKVKDMKQAAYYHQQVVEISREKGLTVLHYSRSAFYVGRYHVQGGGGDWGLARGYLSEVAQSNAEEVAAAQDVLKDLERRMVEAMAQQRVVAGPPSMFAPRK